MENDKTQQPTSPNNATPDSAQTPRQQGTSGDYSSREKHAKDDNAGNDDLDTNSEHTQAEEGVVKDSEDVLIVDWDGPDDPQNPKKYVYYLLRLQTNLIRSAAGPTSTNGLLQLSSHVLLLSALCHPP